MCVCVVHKEFVIKFGLYNWKKESSIHNLPNEEFICHDTYTELCRYGMSQCLYSKGDDEIVTLFGSSD